MLKIHGAEVVWLESVKDFGSRTLFNTEHQYRTALRWSAAPRKLERMEREQLRVWDFRRFQASREFTAIVEDLVSRPETYTQALAKADSWLERWSLSAYRAGLMAAGIGDLPMNTDDDKFMETWVKAERAYLITFFKQIRRSLVSMSRARMRARMYANTLDALVYSALVGSFPQSGTEVHWVLGVAEHCPDCLRLSRKTYKPKTLPTTPRAGATRCMSNCKCTLVVLFHPAAIALVPSSEPNAVAFATDDKFVKRHGIEDNSPIASIWVPIDVVTDT